MVRAVLTYARTYRILDSRLYEVADEAGNEEPEVMRATISAKDALFLMGQHVLA